MHDYEQDMFLAPLSVGDKVPNFAFEVFHDEKIKQVHIDDYKGSWLILFFYPADFTFVCPTELEDMQREYEDLKTLGAEVISVSTDTVYTHKAWHDHSPAIGAITYPMAADPSHELSESFGLLIDSEGIALRGTFVINPEGKICLAEINDNSIGRNAKELVRKVKAAKFVSEHDGLVCPANWEEGGDTLTPGLDLVGKI